MLNLILVCFSFFTSIYSISISSANGNINLSDYQGRKILIVNTASKSKYADQYASLEQLQQRFKDSLVIIAVPSNDFDNEPDDNGTLDSSIVANYNIHYLVAYKTSVTGDSANAVYKWLTQQVQNNVADTRVKDDFQKYLIDRNGNLVGFFASSVDPMSDEMLSAFTLLTNQNN